MGFPSRCNRFKKTTLRNEERGFLAVRERKRWEREKCYRGAEKKTRVRERGLQETTRRAISPTVLVESS